MENELGILLKKLRGFNSLRTIAEKTNGKISFGYLGILEKGINPNNNQPVKATPETLKILSEVYDYSYEKLLKIAGYLTEENQNNVHKLIEEFNKLSDEDINNFIKSLSNENKEKFIKSLNIK